MKKKLFIDLNFIVDIENYKKSMEKWLLIRKRYEGKLVESFDVLFNKYFYVVKPIIHHFVQIIEKCSPQEYGFYTDLGTEHILGLKNMYEPLKLFQIVNQVEDGLKVQNQYIEKFIEKKFAEIWKLKLEEYPVNEEINWWKHGLDVTNVNITGKVVKGKGEGAKSLGMPTANLEISPYLEEKLSSFPNGVYYVDFKFENGNNFKGAGCLGTNPHYENFKECRRMQVYVLNDFKGDSFYGQTVTVTLKRLIRFEGKFLNFDAFLHAMHNDIQIIKDL